MFDLSVFCITAFIFAILVIRIYLFLAMAKKEDKDPWEHYRTGHYLWLMKEHGYDEERAIEETLIVYPYPR